MKIKIRQETAADYRETENTVREAFWNVYAPGCCEHYLLHAMRKEEDFPAALSLVAESEGKIIGHVACMPGRIEGDDGGQHKVLTLGPIAVLPDRQSMGIGTALLTRSRKIAAALGYRAILLCGNPAYYSRQGFKSAEQYGIRSAENWYLDALQICPLYDGAANGLAGRYFEHPVYLIDETSCANFDRLFPPKEKQEGTPSQLQFLEIAKQRRLFTK